jgi:hypothetical protein
VPLLMVISSYDPITHEWSTLLSLPFSKTGFKYLATQIFLRLTRVKLSLSGRAFSFSLRPRFGGPFPE